MADLAMPPGTPASAPPSLPSPVDAPVCLTLEAEILPDAGNGLPAALISLNGRPYDVGTADDLRAAIVAERARLDQLTAMADHIDHLATRAALGGAR